MAGSTTTPKSTSGKQTDAEAQAPATVPTPESANPLPQSDHVSAAAPGERTEAEVIAAEQAAIELAKQSAATPGAGSPVITPALPPLDLDPDDDPKVVRFEREADGAVLEADEGSAAHRRMTRDPGFTVTRRRATSGSRS